MSNETITTPAPAGPSRRGLMARAGLMGAATAMGAGLLDFGGDRRRNAASAEMAMRTTFATTGEKKFVVTDTDILTFALNTEYFEAEFYSRAASGVGLPDALKTGIQGYGKTPNKKVAAGTVNTYTAGPVPFDTTTTIGVAVSQFAAEIAMDEVGHVQLLRSVLHAKAPAFPEVDLAGSFTTAMIAAGVIAAGTTFDPFASLENFLLAAYFINDIGVTAYVGAAPYLTSAADVATSAGILGVEAYHAGVTRTLAYSLGQSDSPLADPATFLEDADKISTLRNTTAAIAGAPPLTDQGVTNADGSANIIPTDPNSIAFGRGFPALLSLFYLNQAETLTPAPGGFLPAGLNGRIR